MGQSGSILEPGCEDVFPSASVSGCSVYERGFVVLAQGLEIPLVAMDRLILAQFPDRALAPRRFLAVKGRV